MLRSEIISLIQARLGNRSGLDDQIIAEMGLAQTYFEQAPELPWFLRKISTDLYVFPGTFRVALPVDFIREYEDVPLYYVTDPQNIPLQKGEYDRWQMLYGDKSVPTTDPNPVAYSLSGPELYVFPRVQETKQLEQNYYAKAQTLTGGEDIETVWTAQVPLLFVGYVGAQIARHLRDPEGVSLFTADYQQAADVLRRENESRKQAAMQVFMGG